EALLRASLYGMGFRNTEHRRNGEEWLHERFSSLFAAVLAGRGGERRRVFFDVGANKGHYACSFLRHNTGFKVYAFEPNPDLRDHLEESLSGFDFEVVSAGVCDETARRTIHIPTK